MISRNTKTIGFLQNENEKKPDNKVEKELNPQ